MSMISTSAIQLKNSIKPRMEADGYALFRSADVVMDNKLAAAADRLSAVFAALPADPYSRDGSWFRRYAVYILVMGTNELLPTSLRTYYQSPALNKMDGGVRRTFAPLARETRANPFLRHLIQLDFRESGLDNNHPLYQIGVHLVRQTPPADGPAFAHEWHKDGEAVTFSHLISRRNVRGGIGAVADNNLRTLWEGTQEEFLDTFGVIDTRVYHKVSPVERVDPAGEAWRDVLLIDFTPIVPVTAYP